MKLHRIDTVNLNSLYGSQAVDLDATLDGASLFLIFGPTGSGKSTLMDAVSLALFGVTPRLHNKKGVASADPRAVMSRGAWQCSATVCFSKLENGRRQHYRASWSCSRAYKKPDGKLKPPERSLEQRQPDGSWELRVSSNKKKDYGPVFIEVLEEFGVQDFNRSMLLAQGQFDAFLGAKPEERAEILERLTDTSIYQQIGGRAARVHARHQRRLTRVRTLLGASGGLDPEALASLQAQHSLNSELLAGRQQATEQATRWLSWFDDERLLSAKLAQAQASQAELVQREQQAQAALATLSEHERCDAHKAFALLDGRDRSQAALQLLEQEIKAVDASLPALQQAATTAAQQVTQGANSAQLAAHHLDQLRPVVEAASEAVRAHTDADALLVKSQAEHARALSQVAASERALAQKQQALQQAQAAAAQAQQACDAHVQDGALVAAWGPLRSRLDQLIANSAALDADQRSLHTRQAALSGASGQLDHDEAAHAASRQATLGAQRQAQEVAENAYDAARHEAITWLGQGDIPDPRQGVVVALEQARDQLDGLKAARGPAQSVSQARQALAEVQQALAGALSQQASASERCAAARLVLEQAQVNQATAADALLRTQRQAALAELRITLVDGEPCLLCGAEVHPRAHAAEHASDDAALAEAVAAAEGAYQLAMTATEQAQAQHHRADVKVREHATAAGIHQRQLQTAELALTELIQAQAQALAQADLPADSAITAIESAIERAAQRVALASQQLTQLDATRQQRDQAERALREATEGLAQAGTVLRDRRTTLDTQRAQLAEDLTAHATSREKLAQERASCRASLLHHGLVVEANDVVAWRALGDARLQAHDQRVKALADRQAQVTTAQAAQQGKAELLTSHSRQRDASLQLLERQREALTVCAARVVAEREVLDHAWQAALLADPHRPKVGLPRLDAPPAELLDAQRAWARHTRAAHEQARDHHDQASSALLRAQTQRQTLSERHLQRQAVLSEEQAALDASLAALGLPDDSALRGLRLDDAQLSALRGSRQQLADQRLQLHTQLAERGEALRAHQAARPPAMPAEVTRDALELGLQQATALQRESQLAQQDTGAQLLAHSKAVEEQAGLRRQLTQAEREAKVWATLNQHIGVNNGGRFKQFAQALNLSQLLDRSNVHLARLSPRYRLVPRLLDGLPSLEFDLEDLWQVGQRVAPRSLSGGERFIVSLALALGLSDFRALKMPIETLLLDEGFGTLDPATLAVALEALSQLQADGRQVGIISHVVALRESDIPCIEVTPLGGGRSRLPPLN